MNAAAEEWKALAAEFYRDGSWRDIYVFKTGIEDWRNLAHFLTTERYRTRFTGAWSSDAFPEEIRVLFAFDPGSIRTDLAIDVSGVALNCHFFSMEEIEFDLDPAEVNSPSKLEPIFTFMRGLAKALRKEVVLTPENCPDTTVFRASPQTDLIEHTPFGVFLDRTGTP